MGASGSLASPEVVALAARLLIRAREAGVCHEAPAWMGLVVMRGREARNKTARRVLDRVSWRRLCPRGIRRRDGAGGAGQLAFSRELRGFRLPRGGGWRRQGCWCGRGGARRPMKRPRKEPCLSPGSPATTRPPLPAVPPSGPRAGTPSLRAWPGAAAAGVPRRPGQTGRRPFASFRRGRRSPRLPGATRPGGSCSAPRAPWCLLDRRRPAPGAPSAAPRRSPAACGGCLRSRCCPGLRKPRPQSP